MTAKRWVLAVCVAALLVGFWARGTFDHPLYNVGLNSHRCARNGFGAVFCGQELTEYQEHIERGKREGEAAATKAEQEATKTQEELAAREGQIQRESEATQARIQREGVEAQQRIREGGP